MVQAEHIKKTGFSSLVPNPKYMIATQVIILVVNLKPDERRRILLELCAEYEPPGKRERATHNNALTDAPNEIQQLVRLQ